MQLWQNIIVGAIAVLSVTGCSLAYYNCRYKKRSYSYTPKLYGLWGAFVYADLVVFGAFWALVSLIALFSQSWILFLLTISIFWLVRSMGETTYWFHQQFTPNKGNPPEKFWFYHIFQGDSVWFVIQIFWQCITVLTIMSTLHLGKIWLQSL